ncbi:MAG: coenzyme A pyrophosphatase [Bacteroidetes bacterium HGW-Bacteroidetes-5]|jgi:8-oxo-dGTP pyrophosphatase MutT (NUDIX family)|nr:MAG: coenzyme A pyrophosphatase [Bacteroidetes bacterium HGW-Bacteroidetes-5]
MDIKLPPTLPGKEAHLKMAPSPRVITLVQELAPPAQARESAVLVLLTPPKLAGREQLLDWELLLIRRNTYDGVHSGQIAFPGGKRDSEDPDLIATACREAFEELGITRDSFTIIGELSKLYVPPSNFTIYPVLAISTEPICYKPDPREVAEYLTVPLNRFNPAYSKKCRVQAGSYEWVEAPGFVIGEHTVWGATAMIISELWQSFASV